MKMKRLLAIFLALVLALTMVACGKDKDDDDDDKESKKSKSKTEESKDDEDEDQGGAGYYLAVYMESHGEDMSENLEDYADMKMGYVLVLEDDGTGYIDSTGDTTDLEWDKKTINIDGVESSLKWKKGQYIIENEDMVMKFERMSKAQKKEYKNGEWNQFEEQGAGGEGEYTDGDYMFNSLENFKDDVADVDAADTKYAGNDYCTEGVITEICTDEGLEGVKIALSKKDADNFIIGFYFYDSTGTMLAKAQEIGEGNEAKVWFHVNGVNEWYGYDASITAIDFPGSDFPGGGGSGEDGLGDDFGDGDGTGEGEYGTSFILPDLSSGPHEDAGYYLITEFEEDGKKYSKSDLDKSGVQFDMMLCTDGTGYAHFIGEYYDLTWLDGTIVVAVDDSETEELVYTLSKTKAVKKITIPDETNGIYMTFEYSGEADY